MFAASFTPFLKLIFHVRGNRHRISCVSKRFLTVRDSISPVLLNEKFPYASAMNSVNVESTNVIDNWAIYIGGKLAPVCRNIV